MVTLVSTLPQFLVRFGRLTRLRAPGMEGRNGSHDERGFLSWILYMTRFTLTRTI